MKPNTSRRNSRKKRRRKTGKNKSIQKKWNYGGKTVGGRADKSDKAPAGDKAVHKPTKADNASSGDKAVHKPTKADNASSGDKANKKEYEHAIEEVVENGTKVLDGLKDAAKKALKNTKKSEKSGFTDSVGYRESFASEHMDSGSGALRNIAITPRRVLEAFRM